MPFPYFTIGGIMFIYNARIYTVTDGIIENGYVEIIENTITSMGASKPSEVSECDIDAHGLTLYPGFIDIHTHMGLIGDGIGVEGDDFNEDTDPITPNLRVIDAINPMQQYFLDAQMSGITTVVTAPGSTNPIGGTVSAIKTAGRCVDDMLVADVGIKMALGENPKSAFSDKDSAPVTRMATAAVIREALTKAKRYACDIAAAKEASESLPEYDAKWEALLPLLDHKLKAHIHCHAANDILTAQRICREFDIENVLIHCTEGYLIADLLKRDDKPVYAAVGPVICDRNKPELRALSCENAALLSKNGILTAICTDHPETPIQYLTTTVAAAVKGGLSFHDAVRSITINPAMMMGLDERIGSVSVGKDADLVLFDGNPFELSSRVTLVLINGKIVYKEEL